MSSNKKTYFNDAWIEQFPTFLQRVANDPSFAYCSICRKKFALSNMGIKAIYSHAKGIKHVTAEKSISTSIDLNAFMETNSQSTKVVTNMEAQASTSSNSVNGGKELCENMSNSASLTITDSENTSNLKFRGVKEMLEKDSVTTAEIIWCINAVMSHLSIRSCASSVPLFKVMFPDSEIAQKMQLQRTKLTYTITYGIAPYFHEEMINVCKSCSRIVVGFDEALNKVVQKGQMDISVRFWSPVLNEVSTRYFGSAFLGGATSVDLLKAFIQVLKEVDVKKVLQVSMDGPNVNLKFHKDLKDYLKSDSESAELVDLGTCGLHTVNNSFKLGIESTNWGIAQFLRSLFNLFNKVPARRADYIRYSGSKIFPLKYCSTRWTENFNVSERAIQILPNLIKYIEGAKKDKNLPSSDSCKIVENAMQDKFLELKLSFFQTLAADMRPFLVSFQSDLPLAPFLYEELLSLMRTLMTRFVKTDVLEATTNITKIDISDSKNLLTAKDVNLGFTCRNILAKSKKLKLNDLEILHFKNDSRNALIRTCKKLMERSPLKYRLTKGISFLDPEIGKQPKIRDRRLRTTLDIFTENKQISGITADKIERQFKTVCSSDDFQNTLKSFNKTRDRLDHFWCRNILNHKEDMEELTSFLKHVFILSHGNASLERGFSINKEMIVENLQEDSLVAQRQIYDAILDKGGIENFVVPKSLISSARKANSRYTEIQKKRKLERENENANQDQKRIKLIAIKNLEDKKKESEKETAAINRELELMKKNM